MLSPTSTIRMHTYLVTTTQEARGANWDASSCIKNVHYIARLHKSILGRHSYTRFLSILLFVRRMNECHWWLNLQQMNCIMQQLNNSWTFYGRIHDTGLTHMAIFIWEDAHNRITISDYKDLVQRYPLWWSRKVIQLGNGRALTPRRNLFTHAKRL